MLGGIREGGPDLGGVVLLMQRAGRAGDDALTAGDAVHLGQVAVKGAADMGGKAAVVGADDADTNCCVAAGGHAAAAQNALVVVAHQMGGQNVQLILRDVFPS